jgi:hypothetical protein
MPEPLQDQSRLEFRERLDRQPRRSARRSSNTLWIVVAVIAALVFVLLIRTLLARTASSAASTVVPTSGTRTAASEIVREYPPVVTTVPMVYRCEGRSGSISLQSQPCAPGERTTRAVPAPPDIEPAPPRYTTSRRSDGAVNNGQIIHVQSGGNEGAQRTRACAQARREREDTLERVGLNRSYDLLQQLDAMVRRACKGL